MIAYKAIEQALKRVLRRSRHARYGLSKRIGRLILRSIACDAHALISRLACLPKFRYLAKQVLKG